MREAGVIVVDVDYRLCPENIWGKCFQDAWDALNWVRTVFLSFFPFLFLFIITENWLIVAARFASLHRCSMPTQLPSRSVAYPRADISA
ncbi:hypothetical protein VTG60DRAFT_1220 [Thermothelomyces hinnuleus]